MKRKLSYTLLLSVAICLAASAQNADAILGIWVNPDGEGHVLIYKIGDKYFGKLDWIKSPNDEKGKPKTDCENPDPALRSRPALGLEILKDFIFDDNIYEGGTIYDPECGKTYSCKIMLDRNTLKIRGYVIIPLFGRSEVWTRLK